MMKDYFSDDKRMLEYSLNKLYSDIFCFSTTRTGGYSEGQYASFNCNWYCGDSMQNVQKNQQKLVELLPADSVELVIPHQVHTDVIYSIDDDYMQKTAAEKRQLLEGVDALVSSCRGICLCISTADCIPVLCYDPHHHAIAAIHAGWRGTVAHVVQHTIGRMTELYDTRPQDVKAIIGPGISQEAFEVGDEVYHSFSNAGFDMSRIARRYEKWHIDLWEANRMELIQSGLRNENIHVSGICTYGRHDEFFSARRLGIKSGRILSGIMLMPLR